MEYISPEVFESTSHNHAVDWWAVGILLYEMVFGTTPFFHRNRQVLKHKVCKGALTFPDPERYGIKFSTEFEDLVTRLLDKDKENRLGTKGGA